MSAQPEVEQTVGNYTIERSLAHGSMGHVYVARHSLTHARVALKVLRVDLAADAQAEERFLREVRAAAHIGHEGIVKVHDAGRTNDGLLYLAMELLHGETLEDRMAQLQGQRLVLLDLVWRALAPLAAAHAHGIVHRDLKPANVFICVSGDGSEQVKLLDFGLARDTREKSGTETGIALGTPYYMSPEQAMRPKLVGPASDVWSIGVMLYEILSGHMPFEGETLHAVVLHSTTSPHLPLIEREPQLDRELCALVEQCLQKEPAERPADATALLSRLSPLLEDEKLRASLSQPVVLVQRSSDEPLQLRHDAMPFADTAISLSPRLLESDMRVVPRRSTRGLWISALALLVLAAVSFLWALTQSGSERTVTAKPSPVPVNEQKPTAAPIHEPPPSQTNSAARPNPKPASKERERERASEVRSVPVKPPTAADKFVIIPAAPTAPPPSAANDAPTQAAPALPSAPTSEPVNSAPPEHSEPEQPPAETAPPTYPPPDQAPPLNDLPPPDPPEPAPDPSP